MVISNKIASKFQMLFDALLIAIMDVVVSHPLYELTLTITIKITISLNNYILYIILPANETSVQKVLMRESSDGNTRKRSSTKYPLSTRIWILDREPSICRFYIPIINKYISTHVDLYSSYLCYSSFMCTLQT